MKKLVSIFAAGALVLAVAPSVFAANEYACERPAGTTVACTTGMTLYVATGTTIYVPAAFYINPTNAADGTQYFPGQVAKSATRQVGYVSNEGTSYLKVQASDLSDGGEPAILIDNEDLLWVTSPDTTPVQREFGTTALNAEGSGSTTLTTGAQYEADNPFLVDFQVWVHVPGVPANDYTGTLTWSVGS